MERFDLIVIGAGPSGFAATMRAMDFKKKTLLVEKENIGGAGITNGALSSKTWWELSRETRALLESFKRYSIEAPDISFRDLKARVDKAVGRRKSLLQEQIDFLRDNSNGSLLSFAQGEAKIVDTHQVMIESTNGKETVYGESIILATGSRPRMLDSIPVDEKVILTSNGIEDMDSFPESMVIVGAGVIGCEYATIFSGFGKTKVHLIDKGDRILPFEDEDIVAVIEENMERNGILIHRNSKLIRIENIGGKVEYELEYTDGRKEVFHVDKALVSVGRVPNYEDLWTDNVDIELTSRGIVDQETRTSIENIYAVGDITADIALVNVGELEGRYAVERIFGNPDRKLIYENISTIMFLHPEVAGVGLNENQAREKGLSYKVVTLDYHCISRAIAERNEQGIIKLLVTDNDENKILGMRVVGNHASSAIQAVALLISMDKGIEELAECVHPHPSITEGIQECVRMLLGISLLKPAALRDRLSCRRYSSEKYEDIQF